MYGWGTGAWRQGGSLSSPPGRQHLFPYKVLSLLPHTASDKEQGGVVGGGASELWELHPTHPPNCARVALSGAAESQTAPGLLEAIAYRWPLKTQAWPGSQDPWFSSPLWEGAVHIPHCAHKGSRAEQGLPSDPPLILPRCQNSVKLTCPRVLTEGPRALNLHCFPLTSGFLPTWLPCPLTLIHTSPYTHTHIHT